MSRLHISNEVWAAFWAHEDPVVGVQAAAPLVVAAELRVRAADLMACATRESDHDARVIRECAMSLGDRANELEAGAR